MANFGVKFVGKNVSERFRRMAAAHPRIVDEELHAIATEAAEDFSKTAATFDHSVEFEVSRTEDGEGWGVLTDDEIWNWIDRGVDPHIIRPVVAPVLRFTVPYRAKTKVHTIASYQGALGTDEVFAREVHHPGIEAREFTETIFDRWQPRVAARIRRVLNEGTEAMGL